MIYSCKAISILGLLFIVSLSLSGVWPTFVLAQTPAIHAGHSAHWYNPDRSGEGWVLEILDDDHANLYWFTYDEEGDQRWLSGVGNVGSGVVVFPEMVVTRGGRFGQDFDPDEVEREVAGELEFRFNDCSSGEVEYAVFGQSGVIPVQRLTRTTAVDCPPLDGRPVHSAGAYSGSWYDPTHSGEGFVLQWLDRDEAVVTWFTYDPEGNQFWMIGVGQTDGDALLVVSELAATRGARFGEAFDPDEVEYFGWGELIIQLDCTGGSAYYASVLSEFGSGSQQLSRLTALDGVGCPLFMPALGEIADARWDQRFHIAGLSHSFASPPQVYDFVQSEDGGMLVAGDFTWFGQSMVPPLLHGDAHSGEWLPLAALEIDTLSVTALASDPGHGLALASQERGFFPLGQPLAGEIVLADGEGQRSIGRFAGAVRRLVWHHGRLWAGGWFQLENNGPTHLAVWDGTAWRPPPGGEPNAPVYALSPDGDGLLVGGEFQSIGGIEARGVARVEDEDWSVFDLPARVLAVERIGEDLYAAGSIMSVTTADGTSGGVVRWNGSNWDVVGEGLSNISFPGVVSDIQLFQGALYALGCFLSANGPPGYPGSEPALGLARWTGQRWETLDPGLRHSPSFFLQEAVCGTEADPSVVWLTERQRLASDGEHLYIGGAFPGIDGVDSHSLIAFDGERLTAQGEAGLGHSGGYLHGLAVGGPDDAVYGFSRTFDSPAPMSVHVARFDETAGWQAMGPPLPGNEICRVIDGGLVVDPLEVIYVGCLDFSVDPSGQSPATRVLRMDGDQWIDIPGTEELSRLFAMTLDRGGALWIAGGLLLDGSPGTGEGYIARLVGDAFEIIENGFDGPVSKLSFTPALAAVSRPAMVAGGTFTRVADLEVNFITHYDGEDWRTLGDGLPDVPSAIEFGRDRIFASATASGGKGLALGAFDGEQWVELATAERNFPQVVGTPWFGEIREVGERLFLAGNVTPAVEDWPDHGSRLYIYEDGRFESLGGGAVGFVDRLELRHDAVWFLGDLIEVDPAGEPVSSLGLGRLAWP